MQLPFFDFDLQTNVIMMPDKWVIKLSIEVAQLIATSYTIEQLDQAPKTLTGKVRSNLSHKRHPITRWANLSLSNWIHSLNFAFTTIEEYKYRYEKGDPFHIDFLRWCQNNIPKLPDIGFTEPYKPIGYEELETFQAYRKYFIDKKQHIAAWRKRETPHWFINK
jgi:hypothetical protein